MKPEQWIVGDEYDDEVFDALAKSLQALGYSIGKPSSAMAGSQDITTWEATGPRGVVTVETETYVGLSVRGDTLLVEELRRRFLASKSVIGV